MLKVGITGGIGTGKTTVCKLFTEHYNIPVYYADRRAKHLMNFNSEVKDKIKTLLGSNVYHKNGKLNRQKVASIVFKQKELLTGLNKIVHPAVQIDGDQWFNSLNKKYPYAIKEAALLYESKSHKSLDKIIVVHVQDEIRIKRVMKRDNSLRSQVIDRINNQIPQEKKMKKADFLLENDTRKHLIKQIADLHLELLHLSKSKN